MPRPKPPEELDGMTIRPPVGVAKNIRALAKQSKMSVNEYVVHLLTDAADRGVVIRAITQITIEPTAADRGRAAYSAADTAASRLNDKSDLPKEQ